MTARTPARGPATQAEPPVSAEAAREALAAIRAEVAKAVVGQDAAVTGLVVALLCQGHVLLEGVPGVAKTLLVRTLAAALDLDCKRVQFTPDLMPGDVTGSLVYDARTAKFEFREGPVFTNLLLADEINRTPPKTQAALLEAMEERQVSVDGMPRPLPSPFMVAATQNPVEYEGTYPLPEAQLDRFLLKLTVPLPSRDDEIERPGPPRRRLRPARPRRRRGARRRRRRRAAGRAGRRSRASGPTRRSSGTSSTSAGRRALHRRCRSARRRAARPRCSPTSKAWAWLSGPRLRHPGRREGAGPPDAAAPRQRAARGRARGRHRRRRPRRRARRRAGAAVTAPSCR